VTESASYLDWNATSPLRPEAREAVERALGLCGNASSVHRSGREARKTIERARAQVAELAGVSPEQVAFTSGGTEANATALAAFPGRRLVASSIEHDSVLANAPNAARIPVTKDGVADLAALETLLIQDKRPALVSLMLANNETGAIQPVDQAARMAHAHGAIIHCDAIQAAGKLAFDFRALGCDLMSLSAHKLGGPQGVGALILAPGLDIAPLIRGGGQERGNRAGTENLSGIAGFGAACAAAGAGLGAYRRVAELRDLAEARLKKIAPDAVVFAADAPRLPNTLCIAMPGMPASTQVMALDLALVMVSAGSACSSGKVRRSHVLEAMGAPETLSECAIRISLGWSTTEAEIFRLADAWGALYARSRASAA
jgi:cysteine desulfurase